MTPDQYQILNNRINDLEKRLEKTFRLLVVKPGKKKAKQKRVSITKDHFYVTPRIKK